MNRVYERMNGEEAKYSLPLNKGDKSLPEELFINFIEGEENPMGRRNSDVYQMYTMSIIHVQFGKLFC